MSISLRVASMGIKRRVRPKRRSVLVRFQPWLIAGGVILNVVATISAAMSAFYSSQQTELALRAVNQQSRNEAFLGLVKGLQTLCSTSMTAWDQVDFAEVGYDEKTDEELYVRHYSYDEIAAITKEEMAKLVAAYSTLGEQHRQAVWDQFDLLRIWLSKDEENGLIRVLPPMDSLEYQEAWLNEGTVPPPAKAIEVNYRCLRNIRLAMDFYRGDEAADTIEEMASAEIIARPFSRVEGKSSESILLEWGREDLVQTLKRHQMIE